MLHSMIGEIDGLSNNSRFDYWKLTGIGCRQSGLSRGDLVKSVNGKEIKYFRELENAILVYQNQNFRWRLSLSAIIKTQTIIEVPSASFSSLTVLGSSFRTLFGKIVDKTPAAKLV